jgi:hypothetical protein
VYPYRNYLAIARLAFLRKYGRPGIKINKIEAEEWVAKMSTLGPSGLDWLIRVADVDALPAGQYALGVCFHDGIGTDGISFEISYLLTIFLTFFVKCMY